jgi:hypothetical protein
MMPLPNSPEPEGGHDGRAKESVAGLRDFLSGHLPLQSETAWFILANCLDVFMTYVLIRAGAIESNPIANYFLERWGFAVMIYFKMFVVAFVCVIGQIVAWKNLARARQLMGLGILIVGAVVVYSAVLYARHFR